MIVNYCEPCAYYVWLDARVASSSWGVHVRFVILILDVASRAQPLPDCFANKGTADRDEDWRTPTSIAAPTWRMQPCLNWLTSVMDWRTPTLVAMAPTWRMQQCLRWLTNAVDWCTLVFMAARAWRMQLCLNWLTSAVDWRKPTLDTARTWRMQRKQQLKHSTQTAPSRFKQQSSVHAHATCRIMRQCQSFNRRNLVVRSVDLGSYAGAKWMSTHVISRR